VVYPAAFAPAKLGCSIWWGSILLVMENVQEINCMEQYQVLMKKIDKVFKNARTESMLMLQMQMQMQMQMQAGLDTSGIVGPLP
jgi:hypothetical protein